MKRLEGKRAVITGGAQGLGEALAKRMAQEGAKVVIGDLNEEGAKQTASTDRRARRHSALDVSDYDSCEQFMKKANDYLGGIDIFVSNAAILFSGAST